MYVVVLKTLELALSITFSWVSLLVALQQNKSPTKISLKYVNYADIFSFNLIIELLENNNINKYVIKLIDGKHYFYRPIYSLNPVELENFKVYIETHLKIRVIYLFKFQVVFFIFFYKKSNSNFCLCINY